MIRGRFFFHWKPRDERSHRERQLGTYSRSSRRSATIETGARSIERVASQLDERTSIDRTRQIRGDDPARLLLRDVCVCVCVRVCVRACVRACVVLRAEKETRANDN